jgi:hypothetical protein
MLSTFTLTRTGVTAQTRRVAGALLLFQRETQLG